MFIDKVAKKMPSPFMGERNVALLTELKNLIFVSPFYKHSAALRLSLLTCGSYEDSIQVVE